MKISSIFVAFLENTNFKERITKYFGVLDPMDELQIQILNVIYDVVCGLSTILTYLSQGYICTATIKLPYF